MNDVAELLEATAGALGLRLDGWAFLSESVYGDGLIRCYELTLGQPDAAPGDAPISQVVYLETSTQRVEHDGILVFRDEASGDEVAVWIYPTDPALPALPVAVFPDAALTLLQRMGLPFTEAQLTLVAYRPGKRAVVRVAGDGGTVWIKVVRPKTIRALHELYALWEAAELPVPHTLGWSDEGLIGFTQLPGVDATGVVTRLGESFFDSVERLTAEYGALHSTGPARASLAASRDWYARKATEMHPSLAAPIEAVRARIDALLTGITAPSLVTVHGDLHLGQVFVDPDDITRITGILDIDTAGLGDPADDAAAMYAHLVVSRYFQTDPDSDAAEAYARLAERWLDRILGRAGTQDPQYAVRVRAIAATHLIAHSLGGVAPAASLVEHAARLLH